MTSTAQDSAIDDAVAEVALTDDPHAPTFAAGEPQQRHGQLRQRVLDRRHTALELDEAAPERTLALQSLIEAADDLLAFEDRLPVLKDLPARALSVQLVRAGALALGLGAVLVAMGIWRDLLGVGWWLTAVVMVVAAVRAAFLSVAPAAGRHRRQRYLALASGAAAMLLAPLATVHSWWSAVLDFAVLIWLLSALFELRRGSLNLPWRRS